MTNEEYMKLESLAVDFVETHGRNANDQVLAMAEWLEANGFAGGDEEIETFGFAIKDEVREVYG